VQISQGKTRNFQCINAGFIKHTPIADGGLRGHVPTRPGCTTPQIRVLYVAPHLWIVEDPELVAGGFLQTPPRNDALALLLTLGSVHTWYRDFHPASHVPCLAHTTHFTRARFLGRRCESGGYVHEFIY
jgi:hypothetical protein